jgi:hypothetical protein
VAAAVPAYSSEEKNGRDVALIRQATARYHDLDVALADGYEILFDCTLNPQDPAQGGMGIHYINSNLAGDDILELSQPEVLMYEPQANGQMKLLGVEYIIFEEQWGQAEAPEFLGQTLKRKTAVGVHEVPPFYEVHAWVWKHNPSGMFADWNPDVTCP